MAVISLRNGGITLVDEADLPILMPCRWARHANGPRAYVGCYVTGHPSSQLLMHRVVMNAARGQIIDHIDGDGLNNQRSNLRFATDLENSRNTLKRATGSSSFKGVQRRPSGWMAQIYDKSRFDEVPFLIGTFDTETDAAKAYDAVARILFGEYGRFNFPRAGEQCALPSDAVA